MNATRIVTSPAVWLRTLETDALLELLRPLLALLPYVYLESETQVRLAPLTDLLRTPSPIPTPAARWAKGRAFGSTLEIAWRRVDLLLVEVTALNESGQPPPSSATAGSDRGWTASAWNRQLDPLTRTRDLLLIEPAYNGGTRLHCIDYFQEGLIVLTRLADLRSTDQKRLMPL